MRSTPMVSTSVVTTSCNARLQAVFDRLDVAARRRVPIVIVGESGTGRSVVARLIAQQSRRRLEPYVTVSCAIGDDTLMEAELFGYERGAFHRALAARPGPFERARAGTVFLRDIDALSQPMQMKLYEALARRTIARVGSLLSTPIDVCIMASARGDLQTLVEHGRFRRDLWCLLDGVHIALPPLRQRREDIPMLTDHFLRGFCARFGAVVPPLSQRLRQAFIEYAWPGNVRQLENACERIALACAADRPWDEAGVGIATRRSPAIFTHRTSAFGNDVSRTRGRA